MDYISEDKLHELVKSSKTDASAFRELYQIFFPRVFAYVAYRVGTTQDTEDIVSETFSKVAQHIITFEPKRTGSFSAWLFRIARNEVNNYFRQNHHSLSAISLADIPQIVSNEILPDDELVQKERFVILQRIIRRLSSRRKEIILLKYFAGMRNQEIASILSLDERTVASHLSRGLQDLHKQMMGEEVFKNEYTKSKP